MDINAPTFVPTPTHIVELERLGDEIAELSAHLDAATAHLLDLIRDFDARGGWGNGFRSCAAWLTWRIGLDPGAARERVRVARALGVLPRLAWRRRRPKSGCSVSVAPAPPSTSSASSALGAGLTATPKPPRPSGSIRAGPCMCIRMKTAWWSSAGDWTARSVPC